MPTGSRPPSAHTGSQAASSTQRWRPRTRRMRQRQNYRHHCRGEAAARAGLRCWRRCCRHRRTGRAAAGCAVSSCCCQQACHRSPPARPVQPSGTHHNQRCPLPHWVGARHPHRSLHHHRPPSQTCKAVTVGGLSCRDPGPDARHRRQTGPGTALAGAAVVSQAEVPLPHPRGCLAVPWCRPCSRQECSRQERGAQECHCTTCQLAPHRAHVAASMTVPTTHKTARVATREPGALARPGRCRYQSCDKERQLHSHLRPERHLFWAGAANKFAVRGLYCELTRKFGARCQASLWHAGCA